MNRLPPSGWLSQGLPSGRRPAAVWLNRGLVSRSSGLEVGMPTVVSQHRQPWNNAWRKAQQQLRTGAGVTRVLAAQEVRDVQARIAEGNSSTGTDLKTLEAAFVKIAKQFGEQRGIGYGAWRGAGVPADALKRAGIARTLG